MQCEDGSNKKCYTIIEKSLMVDLISLVM